MKYISSIVVFVAVLNVSYAFINGEVYIKQKSIIIGAIKNETSSNNLGITTLSSCKAQLDDGTIIDLSSLDNPKRPRIDKSPPYFYYEFNPCSSISCGSDKAAICQTSQDGKLNFVVAEQSTANFQTKNGILTIVFSSSIGKTSNLQCKCGESESFQLINESPLNTYNLVFQSPCCCPNKCKGKPKPSESGGGLSPGSILLIIILVTIFVYLVGGIVYMKYSKGANGLEMIPHIQVWKQLPEDIKTGITYTYGKIRNVNGTYSKI